VNFGRSPILIIVALFLLFIIVTSVLSRKSSTSLNDTDRALRTEQALDRVMNAEASFLKQHGHYTGHIADLVPLAPKIAVDLTDGVVTVQVDSAGDKAYLVQVASQVVSFNRAFVNGEVVARSCLQLKSAGSKYCTRKISAVKKTLPAA
jgi:hypothetical protein